jgi:hypothetical protein
LAETPAVRVSSQAAVVAVTVEIAWQAPCVAVIEEELRA